MSTDAPAFSLPPRDRGDRVSGLVLVRTDYSDDTAWHDALSRMGDLPGLYPPGPGHDVHAALQEALPRRLIVVDDPAWQGATADEVSQALDQPGAWTPDLVLLATDRTAADAELRPLLGFLGTDGRTFRITPRQAALTYLVLHLPYQYFTLNHYAEWASAEPWWEPEDDEAKRTAKTYSPSPWATTWRN